MKAGKKTSAVFKKVEKRQCQNFLLFPTPDNSFGQVRTVPTLCHFELVMWAASRGLKELPGSSPGFCCATVQCVSTFLLVSIYTCILFQMWSRSILVCIQLSPNPVRNLYISCAASLEKDRCLLCAEELRWRCRMPHAWNLTQHRAMMHGMSCTAKRLMPKARCNCGGKDGNQSVQPRISQD